MRRTVLILMLMVASVAASAQKEYRDVKKGNKLYSKEKYVESEVSYRKGLEKNPQSFSGNFNLGNSLFRQEKYEDAAEQYMKALNFAGDDKVKTAAVYHNVGNCHLKAGKPQEAIEAYKAALRNNPKDDETRYNLAYAKQLLKKQQQQQQNQDQQNQDQNQDQQQQQQNQDKQNQQDQNDKDQQNQDKQDQQKQQQQSQSGQQEQGMSKEEAEQILQALQQDEKDTQDKKKVKVGARKRVEKDW